MGGNERLGCALNEGSGNAEELRCQLLVLLGKFARLTSFEEHIDEVVKKPLLLFEDEEIRDAFLSLDVSVLAAQRQSVAIPPPGWAPPPGLPEPVGARAWVWHSRGGRVSLRRGI